MKYRREIDGLRAVAVIPVIFFHAGFKAFQGGYVGVDVFFVISGYLITTILLSDLDKGKFSIINFYDRRMRRILPALFFVLICCLPFAWFWMPPKELKDFAQSLTAVSVYASNFLFWKESGYFDTASELKPLLHTWSLAVEEQFYIFFPILIFFLWKCGKKTMISVITLIALCSFVFAEWASINNPTFNFYLLPSRIWELAIGATAALLIFFNYDAVAKFNKSKIASELCSTSGLLLIIYSIIFYGQETPFPGTYALAPTIGTWLIIMSNHNTLVGRFLSARIMVGIGLISYSTYLWHQPLFAFARWKSLQHPSTVVLLILSALSLFFAFISWYFIEKPFRDKNITSRKLIFGLSFAGTMFFFLIGCAGHVKGGFISRFPEFKDTWILIENNNKKHEEYDALLMKNPDISNAYKMGAETREAPKFIVFGDSHAQTLITPLSDYAAENHISGLGYAISGCPPLKLMINRINDNRNNIFTDYRTSFFNNLNSDKIPEYVILSARWTGYLESEPFNNMEGGIEHWDPEIINKYTATMGYKKAVAEDYKQSINTILASGKKVVLVYPMPEMGWDVPNYLLRYVMHKYDIKPDTASISYDVYKKRNADAYAVLDSIGEHPNLIRIYPDKLLCNTFVPNRCAALMDGKPLYHDDDHLSYIGANLVIKDITEKTDGFSKN